MDRQLQPRVLAIGNAAHADFAEARAMLRRETRIDFLPNAEYTAAWLSANPIVDWVILFQSRPYELRRDIVDRLRPLAGSVRFVSVLGSWCEGELRTGRPWLDVPRVYWHAFPSWWRANGAGATRYSSACSGATGSASALREPGNTSRASGTRGHIVVSTADYATAESLIDALITEGWSAIWWPRHAAAPLASGISAGIWVGGQLSGVEAVQLDSFCRSMRDERAPVVALLDFPRVDRVNFARRIGVSAVLGKPWRIEELSTSLQHLIDSQSATTDIRLAIQSA